MNNIDGSYYAAVQLGQMHSQKIKEREREEIERKRYEEEKRRSWIQFWIPLIVTNIISIAALLVAILAYLKQ